MDDREKGTRLDTVSPPVQSRDAYNDLGRPRTSNMPGVPHHYNGTEKSPFLSDIAASLTFPSLRGSDPNVVDVVTSQLWDCCSVRTDAHVFALPLVQTNLLHCQLFKSTVLTIVS